MSLPGKFAVYPLFLSVLVCGAEFYGTLWVVR